jgi:hypothetical protein
MKEIFTHQDSARVGLCRSLLDEAGIACFVRNDAGGMIAGVPIPVFYPALCIINDADYDRARAIVAASQATVSATGGDWICPHCQSAVPATFASCWNCERERPAAPDGNLR